jgi:two-component system, NtrC family, sensor histidine kinase PilS
MVSQNAKRLEKIVEDILDVARVPAPAHVRGSPGVDLNEVVQRICTDWSAHSNTQGTQRGFSIFLPNPTITVNFDPEHLRRVLVNLLDNAVRYATSQVDAIQVSRSMEEGQSPSISIWSDGPPMDQSVERHLFEPFFSSESRSSGLGLYICRELCTGHGATIFYQRNARLARGESTEGNEFIIGFARPDTSFNGQ